MGKYSNLIVIIIASIIAIIPGSIALKNDIWKVKYNLHEQMIASYQGQIKSAEERGAKDEADSKRKEYEQYEEGWRAEQTINELSIQIIYSSPEGVSEHQQKKFSDVIKAVENSPVSTSTNTISLGATYLGVEDYEKALESFDIVLATDPDDTDARIFKARTLVSIASNPHEFEIATTSPGFKVQGIFPEFKAAAGDLIIEAGKLITFGDLELSNKQDIFTAKIKTDIDILGMKIDEWKSAPVPAGN